MKKPLFIFLFSLILFSCSSVSEDPVSLSQEFTHFSEEYNPVQEFFLDTNMDTIITGEKGTRLHFNKDNLVFPDGSAPTSPISVQLKEVYSIQDMILNNISTVTTEGRLLQSSGMVYLEANSNGKELKLKEPLKIEFRKVVNQNGFQTFLGNENGNRIIWELDIFEKDTEVVVPLLYGADSSIMFKKLFAVVNKDTFEIISEDDLVDSIFLDSLIDSGRNVIWREVDHPYHLIHTTQLKWINCDIFNGVEDVTQFTMINPDSTYSNFVVFHEFNSAMNYWISDQEQMVSNIPMGSKLTIIGLKKIKDNLYQMAIQPATISQPDQVVTLNYQETTKSNVLNQLSFYGVKE